MDDLFSIPDDQQAGMYIPLAMNNLVPVVASGLIRPRQLYGKYYVDTLSIRPDVIPVLQHPPGQSILSLCESEGRNARSVIIEIGKVPGLSQPDAGTTGLIPLRHIRKVHCRSEEEAAELADRSYETASMKDLPVFATPELFSGEGIDLESLRQQIAHLPPGPAYATELAELAHRLTGGLLAVAGLDVNSDLDIAQILQGLLKGEWVPPESAALRMITDTLQGHSPGSADGRLLQVLITTLATLPLDDRPGTDRLLDQFRETAVRLYPHDDRLLKWIRRVSEVLVTQKFRQGSDEGASVVFGLLIHATRPVLSDQALPGKGWNALLTSGEPLLDTLVVARFLTGLRTGRSRLNVSDRNRELDQLCAELESLVYGRPDHQLFQAFPQKVEVGREDTGTARLEEQAMPAPGAEVAQHTPEIMPVDTAPLDTAPLSQPYAGNGNVSEGQRDEVRYQPALAYIRGWYDLITTKIILDAPTSLQVIPGPKGSVTLELTGKHTLARQITDQAEFETRMTVMPFTEAEYREAAALLADPAVRQARRKPRSSQGAATQEKKRVSKRSKAATLSEETALQQAVDPVISQQVEEDVIS